ncbi:MAG: arsenite methyltransferase [Polyangiaceae bacterium]
MSTRDPREVIRENYARRATLPEPETGQRSTPCCGGAPTALDRPVDASSSLAVGYRREQLDALPEGADMGLGCGTPIALAALREGETVIDLGSGGGLDCFLAAAEVGEVGAVIGVDMTPEMLTRARKAAAESGARNVEFRLGEIENLPVADATADVVISNCVINLSPDKQRVYDECYRVLKPGGRVAFSDVVEIQPMSDEMRQDALLTSCCVGGARTAEAVQRMLETAGFVEVAVKVQATSREFIKDWVPGSRAEDYVASAAISARKPTDPTAAPPKRAKACCS